MFTKFFSTISLALALSVHVNGHTLMTPALGVQGAGARSDVQRLARTGGCGEISAAENIDTSTPVAAAADGTFTVTATNFNRLRDGSRELTATMDTTGTGQNFNGAVTVTQNGDPRPKSLGSDQIVAALPAGTTCTGGASGNLCLVSFQNSAIQGFGNCVVVSQGAAAGTAAAGTAAAGTGATAGTATGSAAGTEVSAETGASTAGEASGAAGTASTGDATAANTGDATTAGTGAAASNAGTGVAASNAGNASSAGTGAVTSNAGTGVASNAGEASSAGTVAGNAASAGTGASSGSAAISQAGSRAARALLAELEARGENALSVAKRGVVDWVWA